MTAVIDVDQIVASRTPAVPPKREAFEAQLTKFNRHREHFIGTGMTEREANQAAAEKLYQESAGGK
jgi:hypothetical protein